ncbi:MAG: oxidoreductase, short chain dehydrogenase [Alphaproteobacteria bacterium]|nr:oxidoreductase, short chain dehydrogenase [Alphaproteobacteria bacterium]
MKNPKTILITGASSGIGWELSLSYAASGILLLLAGRDEKRLADIAAACAAKGAAVKTTNIPVTARAELSAKIAEWDDATPIDVVIANAGISGGHGKAGDDVETLLRNIIATNIDGMFNTVNPLIDRMRARKSGQIVLMSSIAGFRGLPSAPAEVNIVFPGFVRTPLTDANDFAMPFMMETTKAARLIRDGLNKNRAVIAFPWQMRAMIMIITALPRFLGDAITARALKKKR